MYFNLINRGYYIIIIHSIKNIIISTFLARVLITKSTWLINNATDNKKYELQQKKYVTDKNIVKYSKIGIVK